MRKIFLAVGMCILCSIAYAQGSHSASSAMDDAQAHYNKGKEYLLKKEYYKANEEFKKAEEILSKRKIKTAVPHRAVKKKRHTKITEGETAVNPAAEKAVKEANYAKDTAGAETAEDVSNGIKGYLNLLKFMPGNSDVYYDLGVEYLKKRDYFNAAREFKQVIRLNPNDGDAYYNLGILYEVFFNNKRMAVTYYRKYLEISPQAKDKKIVEIWVDLLSRK